MANHFLEDLVGSSGGMRAVQKGYIDNATTSTGTGEDAKYVDITIATVLDTLKCYVIINASASNVTNTAGRYSDSTNIQNIAHGRLTSTTNLRVSAPAGGFITGRWQIVEFS